MVNIQTTRFWYAFTIVVILLLGSIFWQGRPSAWSPERMITNGSGDSRIVDILADPTSSTLHLVWEDDREGRFQVYYKRSLDDGATWGPERDVSNLALPSFEPLPRILSFGSRVLVFFSGKAIMGEHLYYVASTDYGSTFSRPQQLTNDAGYQTNVAASNVGTTVHLVWQDYANGEEHIFYMRSSDFGSSWSRASALTNATGQDRHPSVASIGDKVFVVWSRFEDGREAVLFRGSRDSGAIWDPEEKLSDYQTSAFQIFPSIASNGTNVYVVWNAAQVEYVKSSDGGSTWGELLFLTNRSRQYLAPKIATTGSELNVVTAAIKTETTNPPLVTSDVYYIRGDDGGKSWTRPESLTNHSGNVLSLAPALSIRDNSTFVAWQDNRNGRFALFFKSKPDFTALRMFENNLLDTALILLIVSTAAYLLLEVENLTTARRNHRRQRQSKRRLNKKLTRANASEPLLSLSWATGS